MDVRVEDEWAKTRTIPDEWSVAPLKACCTKITVGFVGTCEPFYTRETDGVLLLRTGNLQGDRIDLSDVKYVTKAFHEDNLKSRVNRGDVLIARHGNSGNAVVVPNSLDDVNALNIVIIRTDEKRLLGRFAAYAINSDAVKHQVLAKAAGSTQVVINTGAIADLILDLPPIREQREIAEILGDSDAMLESLEQLLVKKRQLKQGAMQELLSCRKRLPGFSGDWEIKRLGNTATLKARIGWQGLTTAEYLNSGDYYLVTGTEFREGFIDWDNCHYVDEARYKQDKHIQLSEHDVLVTKDGTIGKVALISSLPKPATLNSGVFVIRPIEGAFHPEFFYWLLRSDVFTKFLAQLSAGSTINHLYQKDFVNFTYRTPAAIAEQAAIATILSGMDREIAALEAKLGKARHLRHGVMQELLIGRIRLV